MNICAFSIQDSISVNLLNSRKRFDKQKNWLFAFYAAAAPIGLLGWFLWYYERLDTVINRKHYPDLVGKGIYKEETDD